MSTISSATSRARSTAPDRATLGGCRRPDTYLARPRTIGLRTGCGRVAVGCPPTTTAEADFLARPAPDRCRSARATRGRSIGSDRPRAGVQAMTQSTTRPTTAQPGAPASGAAIGRIVRANRPPAELYEDAVRAGEGLIAAEGPLVVRTGKHTGRSPLDKFIVREPSSEANIWWGDVNHPITEASYDRLRARLMDYVKDRTLYSQDLF